MNDTETKMLQDILNQIKVLNKKAEKLDPGFKARQSPSGRLEGAWAYHASTGGQQPIDQVGAANDQ